MDIKQRKVVSSFGEKRTSRAGERKPNKASEVKMGNREKGGFGISVLIRGQG